jgi:hypothetical protein
VIIAVNFSQDVDSLLGVCIDACPCCRQFAMTARSTTTGCDDAPRLCRSSTHLYHSFSFVVFTNCHGFYLFISCMTSAALSHQSFHPQPPPYSTRYLRAQWPRAIESPVSNVSLLDCASSTRHDCESPRPWTTHHCLSCHRLMIVCVDRQRPDRAHPRFTRLAATACLRVTVTTDHMSHLT